MPEISREKRGNAITLTRAHDNGYLVRACCSLCCIKRVYEPLDLVKLVGDVGMARLERCLRCEKCGSKDFMQVEFWYPTARERIGLTIRRLIEIKTVRKVVWRDDPPP